MTTPLESFLWSSFERVLIDGKADDDHNATNATSAECHDVHSIHAGGHSEFGVHITYEDLYQSIVFLACIYVSGVVSAKVLKMPNLVGEIVAGIVLGPQLLDFVPNPEAWVLLGEMGLVILVLEAGIDIDVATLKLIGTRGFLIAVVGSILPIGLGILIAYLIGVPDVPGILAAGATFGPTSLGIALNILRGGGILNTPVGQLIISAAVIDDMIALIILSQLQALAGTITVAGVLIPIISALAFLFIGGSIAIWLVPIVLERYVLVKIKEENHPRFELALMLAFLLALMPATYYAKASYLMGAFVSGLAFCTSHELHVIFVRQFKRILQWLMRIFFAASIGFQVPIKDFANGTVIWQGCVFCLALFGKLAVGFLVPNFTQSATFTQNHLRDCLITGFSMAAEGEFAFVIAVFAVDNDLIDKDLYASVVLAVLISTIIPPFLLRFTISYYNKKGEEAVKQAVMLEMERKHDLESIVENVDESRAEKLEEGIRNKTAVFLCIQTQSESTWGLMHNLMKTMAKMKLEVIDHRAWSPRGVNTTLVNEIYAKDTLDVGQRRSKEALNKRMQEISEALQNTIGQPETSKVKVQRWFPGIVQEIVESYEHGEIKENLVVNAEQRLLEAATAELERKQALQTAVTQEKTVEDILREMGKDIPTDGAPAAAGEAAAEGGGEAVAAGAARRPARRRRQKMRSTPVVGGGLFNEGASNQADVGDSHGPGGAGGGGPGHAPSHRLPFAFKSSGHAAELIVSGESYKIRISEDTLKKLRTGYSGEMLDSRGFSVGAGLSIEPDDAPIVNRLTGFVRNMGSLGTITEDTSDADEASVHSVPRAPGPEK